MKYPRPEFNDPNVPVIESRGLFGGGTMKFPVFERPISIKENFKRAYTRNNPVWVPNSMTDVSTNMLATMNGMPEADFSRTERYDWVDWFGVEWTYVPEAGGPMPKIGTHFMEDITDWKEKVKFPNLDDYDFEGCCKKFMETSYDPNKVLQVNIGLGCTERFVALLGGYSEAMVAMALEGETVREYLEAFADWEIQVIDRLCKYLPLDMITYHDDWGTERDTFFSEKMMEEIVYPPTKRIVQHVKEKGICFELHSCGHIERFIPYMIDLGVDLIQIQARANDIPAYKKKWGDKIGFDLSVMPAPGSGKDEIIAEVRKMVDDYAAGGGFYSSVYAGDPELLWYGTSELFYYSREKYEEEQGK
ncbi:MAG: hypothetical protein IKL27_04370 [Oscillospiraceae bacterium]|nr:hypothetical protein [Oscillospiraceae bacterium]